MRLQGVVLDWAGTIVDHGSRAPVAALMEIFVAAGVPITVAEARQSMGLAKKSHIRSILEQPRIRQQWSDARARSPAERDVDALYAEFVPKQLECLGAYSDLIAGVPEAAARMRSRGLKIGTTTGYNRAMLDHLLQRARDQGFYPDSSICPDDAPAGRPAPWMCYLNAIRLETYPLATLVKIGDTPVDIEEGLNAGMWTIGISRTGNEAGLTESEWSAASDEEKQTVLSAARRTLIAAGAHYVVESVAQCDEILDAIDARLASGEPP